MQRRTRTLIFFSFLFLFIISAPAIIAYSQGYRVDWEQKKIVQTGAIYLEPRPAPVKIFVDNKLEKKSNFVFQNIFIGNFLPKTYLIEIKKEGYFTWSKNLTISPKLVTEAKNVMLFPVSPESSQIRSDIKKISFSPHKKLIAMVSEDKIPTISIYDIKEKKEKLIFRALNRMAYYDVTNIQWNKDSTKLLFSLENTSYKKWIALDIAGPEPKIFSLSEEIGSNKNFRKHTARLYKPSIDKLSWSSSDTSTLFFTASEASMLLGKPDIRILFSYDVNDKKLSDPFAYDVSEYIQEGGKIFYISSLTKTLNLLNPESKRVEQLSFSPLLHDSTPASPRLVEAGSTNPIDRRIQLFAVNDGKILALTASDQGDLGLKNLYLYAKKTKLFEKIAGNVSSIELSEDKKKVLIRNNQAIYVYWLKKISIQPFRNAGDKQTIYKSLEDPILYSTWFNKDNEHIIFSLGDEVRVVELDGRDRRNIHTLSDKPAKNLHYDKDSETLYALSENSLYSISLK